MGLDQNLYAVYFSNIGDVEYFPDRFFASDYIDEDNNYLYHCSELAYFRKVNILQGYFEEKYNIDNCEYVRVSDEDIEYLLNVCNKFLKCFSKDFIQEVQDYCDLSLKEYAKKYSIDYSNITIDQSNAGEINTEIFDSINQRFKEIISENKECSEIVEEKLPITKGFFYGDYELNIYYLLDILEVKEAFENVEDFLMNTDDEDVYYYCWY